MAQVETVIEPYSILNDFRWKAVAFVHCCWSAHPSITSLNELAGRGAGRPSSQRQMNSMTTETFTAYVGIDWADLKHDVCVQAADSIQREFDVIPHKVEQIEAWAQSLHTRFSGPIAIALELSKGPVVYALQKYDFFVIFPINPLTLAKYRQAISTESS